FEGWPLGLMDALATLRWRGILLALANKNDETKVNRFWGETLNFRFPLEDFVSRKINGRPKVESIREILAETNPLPGNGLFVDDSPAERAAAVAAFPEMRVTGSNPHLTKRILVWSAETQVAGVPEEATDWTRSVRALAAGARDV
ncbi:MAG TPA: phosphatase, partial [Acidisoma sp.]|nr:phosphatase [Acidisoma sp.]